MLIINPAVDGLNMHVMDLHGYISETGCEKTAGCRRLNTV